MTGNESSSSLTCSIQAELKPNKVWLDLTYFHPYLHWSILSMAWLWELKVPSLLSLCYNISSPNNFLAFTLLQHFLSQQLPSIFWYIFSSSMHARTYIYIYIYRYAMINHFWKSHFLKYYINIYLFSLFNSFLSPYITYYIYIFFSFISSSLVVKYIHGYPKITLIRFTMLDM